MNWPVVAFLNYQRPDLAVRMIEQLKGTHLVALDNGGNPGWFAAPLDERRQWLQHVTCEFWDYATDPPCVSARGLGLPPADPDHALWRLYRVPQNLYYGGGANWLMARVIADWPEVEFVWLCNDDIEGVSPRMAYDLYEWLKANPTVGMLSPAINGTTHVMVQNRGTGGPRDVCFIDVTCPMIRVEMWTQLGGYDPDFVGFGTDVDLCARALKAGWRLVVHDGITVDHPSPGTTCFSEGTMGLHSDPRWVGLIQQKHGKDWHRLTVEGP